MYAKVFAQIYDGTLCTKGPWQALVTFQQLLVLADSSGCVDMTPEAISRRTTVPIEIIRVGLEALCLPDPESRTPTEEGRRIVPLADGRSWGWRVVNYAHYRELKREEDRREYHRQYYRDKRSKNSNPSTISTETQHAQPIPPIAEAEAYAKAKGEKTTKAARKRADAATPLPAWLNADDWKAFQNHRNKLRKPMTAEAERRILAELGRLREAGNDPGAVISQSLMRGWTGVFGFKSSDGGGYGMSKQAALEARNRAAVEEFVRAGDPNAAA